MVNPFIKSAPPVLAKIDCNQLERRRTGHGTTVVRFRKRHGHRTLLTGTLRDNPNRVINLWRLRDQFPGFFQEAICIKIAERPEPHVRNKPSHLGQAPLWASSVQAGAVGSDLTNGMLIHMTGRCQPRKALLLPVNEIIQNEWQLERIRQSSSSCLKMLQQLFN